MQKHLLSLTLLWLAVCGCREPQAVVALVHCSSANEIKEQLSARIPFVQNMETPVVPQGLWRELRLSEEQIGILGFTDEPGEWHVPAMYLRGGFSRKQPGPFGERTGRRLRRFLRHILKMNEIAEAPAESAPCLIAAHTTRAMATEMLAKYDLRAVFVELTACEGRAEFTVETLTDLVYLTGPRAVNLLWLEGGDRRIVLAAGSGEITLEPKPGRDELLAVLPNEKE